MISERLGKLLDFEQIAGIIQRGEFVADVELRQTCEFLSIAIAAAINLFNPATLLIHGRLFEIQDGLFELTVELVRRRALAPSLEDCHIQRARCTKLQGAVATAVFSLTDALGPTLG